MDGLSGASGIFAVVSVAIQLAESIHKLTKFLKAVQDAPANVETLIDELETLSCALNPKYCINLGSEGENVTQKLLNSIESKVSQLLSNLSSAALGFESTHFRTRKWNALKITLKKPEIESLLADIERAKSTFTILRINSIERSTNTHFCNQHQLSLEITQSLNQLARSSKVYSTARVQRNPIMQINNLEDSEHIQPPCSQQTLSQRNHFPARFDNSGPLVGSQIDWNLAALDDARSIEETRLILKAKREEVFSQEWKLPTPFWTIQTHSSIRKITTRKSWGNRESVEKETDYFLYPTTLLKALGISQSVWVHKATSGWQYRLQPFNSVPVNSLIFEFCRDGNISGIQTLFRLGHGSVQDRDPFGRTPLWVAAQCLQVDTADFLLREGANPHESDWTRRRCPPIFAITYNKQVDVGKKIAMISTFQKHYPDDHDDTEILKLMGMLLIFYRPHKRLPMSLQDQSEAALQVIMQLIHHFTPHEVERSMLFFDLLAIGFSQGVLQWTLRNIGGFIHEVNNSSAVHKAIKQKLLIRDPISMKIVTQKTKNLHRFCEEELLLPAGTPTSIAMYQPATFYAWRDIILDLGHDVGEFVTRELEAPGLKDEAWEQDTLAALFHSRDFSGFIPSLGWSRCDRCGCLEEYSRTKVHLPWRRYLRQVRNRLHDGAGVKAIDIRLLYNDSGIACEDSSCSQSPQPDLTRRHGVTKCTWPYSMVCSDRCSDDICVAWVYDNDLTDEPSLPSYVLSHLRPQEPDVEVDDGYPLMNMPGGFVE